MEAELSPGEPHTCRLDLEAWVFVLGTAHQLSLDLVVKIIGPDGGRSAPSIVAVIQDGHVVHARDYGLADLEHDIPITPLTVFDIASVSKQLAGMAIAMLVQQGRLALDDDVRTHIPEVPDFGGTIPIRHLVHHTSGSRDWPATLALAG